MIEGSATLTVDGEPRELRAGEASIVDKGAARALVAGPDGVRYATVHIRREGLALKRFSGVAGDVDPFPAREHQALQGRRKRA